VDSFSLRVFKGGFYISWIKPLRVLGVRSWLVRLVPHLAQHRQFPSICCHSVPYRDDIDFGTMVRCSKQESGTRLVVYKIPVPNLPSPVVVAPAVNSASNVAPLVSYSTSPTSCWALALLESQEMLKDRSDHYKIGDAIGKGTFSTVFKVTFGNTEFVAKRLRPDRVGGLNAFKEVYALERCMQQESGIIPLRDVFIRRSSEIVYIVFDLWEIDLFALLRLRAASPLEIRSAMRDILRGVVFLHDELQMVHADLKTANVLVKFVADTRVPDITCTLSDLGSIAQVVAPFRVLRTH
jgi:serine/threonine protein kinase